MSSPCIFSLQFPTLPYYSTAFIYYIELCVNNIAVTVNTCTCTDVFRVITTKEGSIRWDNKL